MKGVSASGCITLAHCSPNDCKRVDSCSQSLQPVAAVHANVKV